MPRAYRVELDGDEVGIVGEGPGPFVTAAHAVGPHPQLEHARFTSLDVLHEDTISELVSQAASFDALVAALEAKGFVLTPVTYEDVFLPAAEVPPTSAPAADEHARSRAEMEGDA